MPDTVQTAPTAPAPPPPADGPEPVVELRGAIAPDLADYARDKVAGVLRHTGRQVVCARVRVLRHADPARDKPVEANAHVELAGRSLHVHLAARRPREAVDLLMDRLRRQMERVLRPGDRLRVKVHPRDAAAWTHPAGATDPGPHD